MTDAYLSLGSNIGDAKKNLNDAVASLDKLPGTSVDRVSGFYVTAPVGYVRQVDFINICVALQTEMSPTMLLGCCLGIEAAMGRLRPFKNSPRIIDIDLILFGDTVCNTPELTLPHPRMKERAFVLVPLNEVLTEELKNTLNMKILLEQTAAQRVDRLK